MVNKKNVFYSLLILAGVIYFPVQAQQKKSVPDTVDTKNGRDSYSPKGIVRNVIKDRKGNIWIASWEGIFRYNGKSFAKITSQVSQARFFSVLEDRKGNFWFASIGSGVYYYDGKSFQHFTSKDGLSNDRVTHIYEDKSDHIWFGTESGASRYDGKSFQNFKLNDAPPFAETDSVYTGAKPFHTAADSVHVTFYQHPISKVNWMQNDVNAIIEDQTGRFWFGTRGYATVYDGKKFTTITNKDGKPFTNVRSIIKDKKGRIWLGGADGLWCYDGKTFTNYTRTFVGNIYEDKKGSIWTSSESAKDKNWVLSRYKGESLSNKMPLVSELINKTMIFGILEDDKGNIWFGSMHGVHRYNGRTVENFNGSESVGLGAK